MMRKKNYSKAILATVLALCLSIANTSVFATELSVSSNDSVTEHTTDLSQENEEKSETEQQSSSDVSDSESSNSSQDELDDSENPDDSLVDVKTPTTEENKETSAELKFIDDDFSDIPKDIPVEYVDHIEFKELPTIDVADQSEASTMRTVRNTSAISISQDTPATFSMSEQNKRSTSAVTQSFTGTIANEGGLANVNLTLQPGQIVQATLECPKNSALDYDLFLYDYNADGTLGSQIDASTTTTYFNGGKTLDEGVAHIHTGSSAKTFTVIVLAAKGASTTDEFKLTISLDIAGSYDPAEPNDSPYHAYTITEGRITGANLNVSNDQDWFVWNVPSTIKSAKFSVEGASGYDVEVYGTSDGSSMIKHSVTREINGAKVIPLNKGYNYVRVFNKSSSFTPAAYTLVVAPYQLPAAKMYVLLDGDQGQESYPSYNQGRRFQFKNTIAPQVALESAEGYPVYDTNVTLTWYSGEWAPSTGNYTRTKVGNTGDTGVATISLTPPTAVGGNTYVQSTSIGTMIRYYDNDMIDISADGVSTYTKMVYHYYATMS